MTEASQLRKELQWLLLVGFQELFHHFIRKTMYFQLSVWLCTGLWQWWRPVWWCMVRRVRGARTLVSSWCPPRGGVYRGHHPGKKLWATVSPTPSPHNKTLHKYCCVSLKSVLSNFFCFNPSEDFVSSYFVAFSNDSSDWTLLHDGYAEWVIEPQLIMKMFS